MESTVRRGEIYYADLSPVVGSEQGGVRPVLIVQNDTGNRHSPTIIAAAITSRTGKAKLPTHIELPGQSSGLPRDSIILLEQIRIKSGFGRRWAGWRTTSCSRWTRPSPCPSGWPMSVWYEQRLHTERGQVKKREG